MRINIISLTMAVVDSTKTTSRLPQMFRQVLFCLFAFTVLCPMASRADNIGWQSIDESSYGLDVGLGQTADIPACGNCPAPRTNHRFVSLIVNFERLLSDLMVGESESQGALFWRAEAGLATIIDNPATETNSYLINFSPLMIQYRIQSPQRAWNPKFLGGVGFARTNWKDFGGKSLNSKSQFLVHLGAGIEFSREGKPYSIDYRLLHVSNGGSGNPNIGINAHVISLEIPF